MAYVQLPAFVRLILPIIVVISLELLLVTAQVARPQRGNAQVELHAVPPGLLPLPLIALCGLSDSTAL